MKKNQFGILEIRLKSRGKERKTGNGPCFEILCKHFQCPLAGTLRFKEENRDVPRFGLKTFSERLQLCFVDDEYEVSSKNTLFGIMNSTLISPSEWHIYIRLSLFNRPDL